VIPNGPKYSEKRLLDPSSRTMIHGEVIALPSDERVLEALDRNEEFDPSDPKKSLLFARKRRLGRQMEVVVKDGFTSTIDIPVRLNAFAAGTIFVLKSPSSPRPIAAKWRRLLQWAPFLLSGLAFHSRG
jgi:hypothetical protein